MVRVIHRFPLKKIHKIYDIVDGMKSDENTTISLKKYYKNGDVYYKLYNDGVFLFEINRIEIKRHSNYYDDIIKYYLFFYRKSKSEERFIPTGEMYNEYRYVMDISENQLEYIERSLKFNFL